MPGARDVRALKNDVVTVADNVLGREPQPSKTIYLERRAISLTPGIDDAAAGISSVVKRPVTTRGFTGSDRRWDQIVKCVAGQLAPFDVAVTDEKPAGDDYILAVVGGSVRDLEIAGERVGGLSPFSGDPIPRAVVFAFAGQLRNDPRKICETVAHEVGHAYGLDHAYRCSDVMSYLYCGRKRLLDRDARCGEQARRPCRGGAKTQNSYRHLMRVLGPQRTRSDRPAS